LKAKIALFFVLLFSILLITPVVISLIDSTQDIAMFLDINEEENQGQKILKEIKNCSNSDLPTSFTKIQRRENIRFMSKNYISRYPKILTPPPKLVL
jgi:predicted PurR-regulated permease PerM